MSTLILQRRPLIRQPLDAKPSSPLETRTMARMTISNYSLDAGWLSQFLAVTFNGKTMEDLLHLTMLRIINSFGEPLRLQANHLTNANAPVANYLFTGDHMRKYLRDGEFKYNQTRSIHIPLAGNDITFTTPRLLISGPMPDLVADGSYGRAPINGSSLEINYILFLERARDNPALFPEDQTGQERLEVVMGKTILHEMIHNEGHTHPSRSAFGAYNPSDVYWRTFPEVCEQAFFNLFRDDLFPGTTTISNLVGVAEDDKCGTR
jgi:hypothetical protein